MAYTVESIDPTKTALLVIDMQNDFINEGAPMETPLGREMIPTLRSLIDFSRGAGIPVIFTEHAHRASGYDLGRYGDLYEPIATRAALVDGDPGVDTIDRLAPQGDEIVIRKHRYSAFFGTDLEIVLKGMGVDTVVITGVTTECCVHATARDAMFRDYKVVVLSDATATYDYPDAGRGAMTAADVHEATLLILRGSTADVATSEEFRQRTHVPAGVR
jgi:nicotinamidase-related amidase